MANTDIRRTLVKEILIPPDRIRIDKLKNKGDLYIRLERQHIKWWQRNNADIERLVVNLTFQGKSREDIIANLLNCGYQGAKNLYYRIIKVVEQGGFLQEAYQDKKLTPAIFDSEKKQIAFSGGYGCLDF